MGECPRWLGVQFLESRCRALGDMSHAQMTRPLSRAGRLCAITSNGPTTHGPPARRRSTQNNFYARPVWLLARCAGCVGLPAGCRAWLGLAFWPWFFVTCSEMRATGRCSQLVLALQGPQPASQSASERARPTQSTCSLTRPLSSTHCIHPLLVLPLRHTSDHR